jgi:hypothetical protein
MERRRRLSDRLAGAAREFLPHRLDHLVGTGNAFQALGDALAEFGEPAATTWAAGWRGQYDALARQMCRQRAADRLRAGEGTNGCLLRRLVGDRFSLGRRGLEFLELHLQLVEQLTATLGGGAKPVTLHFGDQQLQMHDHRLGAGSPGFRFAACLLFRRQSGSKGVDVRGNRFVHGDDSIVKGSRRPATPAYPMAERSSTQHRHDPTQCFETHVIADAHPTAVRQSDLDCSRRIIGDARCGRISGERHGLRYPNRQQPRGLIQCQLSATGLTAPRVRQARINIMPRRHGAHPRAWFVGLRDDPELLFDAPAPAAFSRAEYLDLAMWHDFKVDLKVGFKVIPVSGPGSPQGGLRRMDTIFPLRSTILTRIFHKYDLLPLVTRSPNNITGARLLPIIVYSNL